MRPLSLRRAGGRPERGGIRRAAAGGGAARAAGAGKWPSGVAQRGAERAERPRAARPRRGAGGTATLLLLRRRRRLLLLLLLPLLLPARPRGAAARAIVAPRFAARPRTRREESTVMYGTNLHDEEEGICNSSRV